MKRFRELMGAKGFSGTGNPIFGILERPRTSERPQNAKNRFFDRFFVNNLKKSLAVLMWRTPFESGPQALSIKVHIIKIYGAVFEKIEKMCFCKRLAFTLVRPQDGVVEHHFFGQNQSACKVEGGPRTNFRRPRSYNGFGISVVDSLKAIFYTKFWWFGAK